MLHFNEDTRVKFPATIQFLRLGYEYQSLKGARIDFDTKIFIDRFKTSLERINKREIPNDEREAWGKDYITNKIHGGENFFDVQERVVKFWKKVTRTNQRKIFIVAHAGLYRALLAHLLDASPYKIFAIDIR